MKYIVFLRNLENGREINVILPMEEEELEKIVEDLNPGQLHDVMIPDAWNDEGENYWEYNEYGNVFEINKLLQAIEDSNVDIDIINAYVQGEGAFDSVEDFESHNWDDMYLHKGCKDMSDVAYDYVNECYYDIVKDLPLFIQNNIDYEGVGQWLNSVGCYFETDYGILEIN